MTDYDLAMKSLLLVTGQLLVPTVQHVLLMCCMFTAVCVPSDAHPWRSEKPVLVTGWLQVPSVQPGIVYEKAQDEE